MQMFRSVVTLSSAVLLLLSACGSSASPTPSPTQAAPASETAAASPTASVQTEEVTATTGATAEAVLEVTTPAPAEATVAASPTVAPPATETPAPQSTATDAPPTEAAPQTITLQKIIDGLPPLTYLTHAGDGRLYLVGKRGQVWVMEQGSLRDDLFLDITNRVGSRANEQGLLSIAFSPNYQSDGAVYVNYTDTNGDTVVSRFTATPDQAVADSGSEVVILSIDQPYANHNGGQLQFGPDGMLYIGMGDGGSGGDPQNNGQRVDTLLGKLLRIDVSQPGQDGQPYSIPADNPSLGDNARREIWAYGLRNPWRFSFDRATNDLYIADVGQNQYEEIDRQPAGSKGGENYGWNLFEGFEPYAGNDNQGLTSPIYQYGRSEGCSVTGGYVYRGKTLPSLDGAYLYSDYCSGTIWALRPSADGQWQNEVVLESGLNVSSFGEDTAGELYVIDLGGAVYLLTAQ